jgi:hypothetical protein
MSKMIKVRELIRLLSDLPEVKKDWVVGASFDGGEFTGIYGILRETQTYEDGTESPILDCIQLQGGD